MDHEGSHHTRTKTRLAKVSLIALALGALASATLAPVMQKAIAVAKDGALDGFLARTPGKRNDAELNPVKNVAVTTEGESVPTQRALGKTFSSPREVSVAGLEPDLIQTEFLSLSPIPLDQIASAPPTQTPNGATSVNANPISAFPILATPVFGVGGNGVGPGGNATGGIGDISRIPAVPSAVPEPDTWMLLVFGIGLIGAAMRRKHRFRRRRGVTC